MINAAKALQAIGAKGSLPPERRRPAAIVRAKEHGMGGRKYPQQMIGGVLGLLLFGHSATVATPESPTSTIDSPRFTPYSIPATWAPSAKTALISSRILQEGNTSAIFDLQPKQSQELNDNYLGTDLGSYDPGYKNTAVVSPVGFKWIRISVTGDPLNWQYVEINPGEYKINHAVDDLITEYVNNGITIILNLGVGTGENRLDSARFKTQRDIDRYGNYVRFMVKHFKGRIAYYEIWNEPDTDTPWGKISVEDYSALIKQVVPAIREENPSAKIVIGATGGAWASEFPGYDKFSRYTLHIDYLTALLRSGVAPLVDVISWHPFYGHRATDPYCHNYPQMVLHLKKLATAEGFQGGFLAEEVKWRTESNNEPQMQGVSEIVAAKYYLRAIAMHRGLGCIVTIALPGAHDPTLQKVQSIHNICDIMAGANPVSMPIEIHSQAKNIKSYGFSLPNGDALIALWTDGLPVDEDAGINSTLILSGRSAQQVMVMDALHGKQQQAITRTESSALAIRNLLLKDYPIILRLIKRPRAH